MRTAFVFAASIVAAVFSVLLAGFALLFNLPDATSAYVIAAVIGAVALPVMIPFNFRFHALPLEQQGRLGSLAGAVLLFGAFPLVLFVHFMVFERGEPRSVAQAAGFAMMLATGMSACLLLRICLGIWSLTLANKAE